MNNENKNSEKGSRSNSSRSGKGTQGGSREQHAEAGRKGGKASHENDR